MIILSQQSVQRPKLARAFQNHNIQSISFGSEVTAFVLNREHIFPSGWDVSHTLLLGLAMDGDVTR